MKSAILLLTGLFFLLQLNQPPLNQALSEEDPKADTTDITAWLQQQYPKLPAPKKEFRSGHISMRKIVDMSLDRVDGFALQLPHQGMTPSPTIYNDLLLVSGGFGSKEYYAFDAKTGQMKWGMDLDDDGPTSAAVVDDIAVFNTESCTIFAVQASSGKLLWSYWLGDPLMSTPAIGNGLVYTAYPAHGIASGGGYSPNASPNHYNQLPIQQNQISQPEQTVSENLPSLAAGHKWRPTHVLIAMDLYSGEIKWQRWLDGDILSAPVVEGTELHLSSFSGTIYQFDAISGALKSAQMSQATSAPSIVGKNVFVSRRADKGDNIGESISMLDRGSGEIQMDQYEKAAPYLDQQVQTRSALKKEAMDYDAGNGFGAGAPANSGWQSAAYNIGQSNVSSLQAFTGSRVLHYDDRNYSLMGDELICTNPKNGKINWQMDIDGDLQQSGGFLATAPIRAGKHIIIATLKGEVIVMDAQKGKETMRFSLGEPIRYAPVVDNGRIYVSSMRGKIYCLETDDPSISGWPTLSANAARTNRIQ
ncbi:MAG: PQQ-binding-like beta-propeller repeat protein [Bacteroidota bacterium]